MLTTIAPKGMTYYGNSYDNQPDNKSEKWNSSDMDIFQKNFYNLMIFRVITKQSILLSNLENILGI